MMIPRHSVGMKYSDYWPYFASRFVPGLYRDRDINAVTEPLMPHAKTLGTPTGRHALWYFLDLKDYPLGSEVLISAYNYYVVVRLVVQAGLTPVFVDIEPDTLCIDPEDVARKVTPNTKLIIATHMFGNPTNMPEICAIAEQNGLDIFEDCAHAVGSYIGDTHMGQFGSGALFSFGVAKIVNCFGGGMLALNGQTAENYQPPKHGAGFRHSMIDTFSRCLLTTIYNPKIYKFTMLPLVRWGNALSRRGRHWLRNLIAPSKNDAAWYFEPDQRAEFKPFMVNMLDRQLSRIESNVRERRKNVAKIKAELAYHPDIKLLNEDKHGMSNGSYFGVYCEDKQGLSEYLLAHNVDNNPQEFFDCSVLAQFEEFKADCPNAQYASQHLIRLPSQPTLKDSQLDSIIRLLKGFSLEHAS
ncbi:glutamine--scyllo-inositol transaminase [Vibrio nigripulchritudo ATCC 27043]|uniref:DegT/DnrJ/EryC1/StrS family aminotransferase n=1 Tax=Vibrio nigripulchritudo TaxID=28173 RepID=UPI00021C26AB|nr:DegT/DnrJ/EryC1/StrS family aminotransferase [Vibrio nigripulchritudo]EGU56305.1 glutamine--scyllo-inositol transaminase [Vibrio nigripulchritudo ATCC 27043]